MALTPGTRLGVYEVTVPIGEGGMGQVYRARDMKLNRDVALKILPEAFASDPDRLARFQREAQVLASLNHPNIAHIHGLEESDGVRALVMELVEGEDLSQRIARGAIPLDETLPIARQIADALEAAHDQGIIHRDLKPANIKLRPDGTVKVLDFGLAKAMDPAGASSANAMTSPTISLHATMAGMILGTAAYMSPEQAAGKPVDKRSDLWAFGVVLLEMLTGRQAFEGETVSHVIAAVLTKEPEWAALPANTPPPIRKLLRRCLEKVKKRRIDSAADVRLEIEDAMAGPSADQDLVKHAAPARRWRSVLPWAVAALAMIAAASATLRPGSAVVAPSLELAIGPPDGRDFQIGSNSGTVTISPDGTMVAFVAPGPDASNEPSLWVRPVNKDEPHPVAGTQGAFYPFWSADSRSLAYFADGRLRTVEIAGGLPQVVADAAQGRGGCWGDNGRILFTPAGGGTVFSVAAAGGPVTAVTTLNTARGENANYWPTCLPGSTHFLYFARSAQPENNGIYFSRMDGTGEPVRVVSSLSSAAFVPAAMGRPAYLLWARDQDLLAQPFDAASGTLRGEAKKMAGGVLVEESQRGLMVSASRTGTLVWAPARVELMQFVWTDRAGRRLETLAIEPGHLYNPGISPDGHTLLFYRAEKGAANIWLHDMNAGTSRRVSTDAGYSQLPAWLPNGRGIIYGADSGITRVMLDGSAAPETISKEEDIETLTITPDGRFAITGVQPRAARDRDLWAIELAPPHTATPLLVAPGDQTSARVSPDGRWLLWSSGDGVHTETFLARLISDGGTPRLGTQRIPVTAGGGVPIGWRRDGREIFYLSRNRDVVGVAISMQAESATLGSPVTLFRLSQTLGNGDTAPTANADGSRFIVTETPFSKGATIRVLTNWYARLTP